MSSKPLDQLEAIVTKLHEARKGQHWHMGDLQHWLDDNADVLMDLIFDAKNEQDELYPDQQISYNATHYESVGTERKVS